MDPDGSGHGGVGPADVDCRDDPRGREIRVQPGLDPVWPGRGVNHSIGDSVGRPSGPRSNGGQEAGPPTFTYPRDLNGRAPVSQDDRLLGIQTSRNRALQKNGTMGLEQAAHHSARSWAFRIRALVRHRCRHLPPQPLQVPRCVSRCQLSSTIPSIRETDTLLTLTGFE